MHTHILVLRFIYLSSADTTRISFRESYNSDKKKTLFIRKYMYRYVR